MQLDKDRVQDEPLRFFLNSLLLFHNISRQVGQFKVVLLGVGIDKLQGLLSLVVDLHDLRCHFLGLVVCDFF